MAIASFPHLNPKAIMRLTELDDRHAVSLAVGDKLEVLLECNPTTGYQWEVNPLASKVLVPRGSDFVSSSAAIGSGGKQSLSFRANEPGRVELELFLRRPFELGKAPLKDFRVRVTVTTGA